MMVADLPTSQATSLSRRVATLALAFAMVLPSATSFAGVVVLDAGAVIEGFASKNEPRIHPIQAQQGQPGRAREQAYIGRLEEEIRRLTGRIDQLEFEQRNIDSRIDKLIGDLDQRLRTLEEGGGPNQVTGDTTALDRQQAEQALNNLSTELAPDRSINNDGQLGSIPESAIAGLPRPNPADVAAPETSTLTPERQYEDAVRLLQAGDYQGAQGGLELFLELNGDHQLASNAAYWLAETHYVRQNYSASAAAFARNYRNFGKDSSKAIDNLLKLGMSLSNLGELDKACLTYDELIGAFPQRPAHIQQAISRERARAQCA